MNHLLKAPFCVHPNTGMSLRHTTFVTPCVFWLLGSYCCLILFLGRVCIPIDPNHCDEFDPTAVPSLSKVHYTIHVMDCLDHIPISSNRRGKKHSKQIIFFEKVFITSCGIITTDVAVDCMMKRSGSYCFT